MAEAPAPFLPIECNLEPLWLSHMAEGMLNEKIRAHAHATFLPLLMLGPMHVLGLPVPSLPLHKRIWRGIKRFLRRS